MTRRDANNYVCLTYNSINLREQNVSKKLVSASFSVSLLIPIQFLNGRGLVNDCKLTLNSKHYVTNAPILDHKKARTDCQKPVINVTILDIQTIFNTGRAIAVRVFKSKGLYGQSRLPLLGQKRPKLYKTGYQFHHFRYPNVRPICLPASDRNTDPDRTGKRVKAIVAGWGRTHYKGAQSRKLMQVTFSTYFVGSTIDEALFSVGSPV